MSKQESARAIDLTQGNFKRQLIKLAAPIIGTSFIQIAYTFTDMAWVGHMGSKELSIVSSAGVLTWLATTFGMMTKVGAEAFVAQALGAKNYERAKLYVRHNFTLALWLALALIALFAFAGGLFLSLYGLEETIHKGSKCYLYICMVGFIPLFTSFALSGSYNASGYSKTPFKINAIGLVTNMILDPIFIYVIGWGTDGSAVATVFSQLLVFLFFLREIRWGHALLGERFPLLIRLRKKETLQIVKLGLPITLLNALFSIISFVMGIIASRAGSHIGLVVITSGGQLEAISWNTSQGLSTALTSFVGQNYAAGKLTRLKRGFRFILSTSILLGVITTCFYFFCGEWFFSLIVNDPIAYVEGGRYFRISAISQIFMMTEITTQGLFYGTGRSSVPSSISILGNLLRIPLALLLLSAGWGLSGIWWAISFTAFLKGVAALSFIPWLKKRIVAKEFV